MSDVFGKGKFGGEFVKRKWFKLKDGESTFRILPPMGDLADEGRWSVFHNVHYGYKNSKGEMRTFQSPLVKNRKTKMVEVPDAALDFINKLKAKLEAAKAAGDKETVTNIMKFAGGQKSRYNLDSNHYMNVIDEQGNIGILKIRHRAKLALDAAIKQLRDKSVEPLDPDTGRFFTFHRSGNALDTVYSVSVKKRLVTVEGYGQLEQDLVHTITPELASRCLTRNKDGSFNYKEAARLDTLFKKPTAEEVARIVNEGEKAVDEILDRKNEAAAAAPQDTQEPDDEYGIGSSTTTATNVAASSVATSSTPTPTITTATVPPTTPSPTTSSGSFFGGVTTKPTVTAPEVKTTAQAVAQMSDEDFLKSMGL